MDEKMAMIIHLKLYDGEEELAASLIRNFWKEHNGDESSPEESLEDLAAWTSVGHRFYFIQAEGSFIGFVHLGRRGNGIDWLEDLFVLPAYQGRGVGSHAIREVEKIVEQYSDSIYIEVAARNEKALRLYRRNGYDCLNTITVRKDFHAKDFEVTGKENILHCDFEIRKDKDKLVPNG